MDIKSQQDADYFEALKKDKEKITKFYEEAFKVPEKVEVVEEIPVKLTPLELRQARIKYFTN
jgi:hypothetical protein